VMPSVVSPAPFSTVKITAVEPAITGHIPATLERPPRRLS
jgi:hypothetical protein